MCRSEGMICLGRAERGSQPVTPPVDARPPEEHSVLLINEARGRVILEADREERRVDVSDRGLVDGRGHQLVTGLGPTAGEKERLIVDTPILPPPVLEADAQPRYDSFSFNA